MYYFLSLILYYVNHIMKGDIVFVGSVSTNLIQAKPASKIVVKLTTSKYSDIAKLTSVITKNGKSISGSSEVEFSVGRVCDEAGIVGRAEMEKIVASIVVAKSD